MRLLGHISSLKKQALTLACLSMTVESDYSQSGTRLNGKFGIELQVNGKSTKWRETMMQESGN